MITIATLFWQANSASRSFSQMYDEGWVERLYRGFARNLTQPFEFVCFTDRPRTFGETIYQERISAEAPDYSTCIEPYRLDVPMILCGLDTVVTGNCDHLADWCFQSDRVALPRDPYRKSRACNGVALVPGGMRHIADNHNGENDMVWMRKHQHVFLDDIFPGQVVSYKGDVKKRDLRDARIVYFHGEEKPHQLRHEWLREAWR